MAHSPEVKAKAVAAYLGGDGWKKVSVDYGISQSTLKQWIDETKEKANSGGVKRGRGDWMTLGPARS